MAATSSSDEPLYAIRKSLAINAIPKWLWNYKTPELLRGFCVCSAVSYFSTRVGSIIGAGRLSFRVRDGSGRFPAAVAAVTLFTCPVWWCAGYLVGGAVAAGPGVPVSLTVCRCVVFLVGGVAPTPW